MASRRTLRAVLLCLCSAGSLLLGGCEDAPTAPRILQQEAGGERWMAMTPPAGLPQLESWLPHLPARTPEGRVAVQRIRALRREAAQALADGRLEHAERLQQEAARVALHALSAPPPPRVVAASLSAVDLWLDRVRGQLALERFPAMEASYHAVAREREAAAAQLAQGDTLAAVHYLAAAGERIREHAPAAVARRVLAEAEQRLGVGETPPELGRAAHLLGNARQELIHGSATRALQRALYALQIIEGRQVGARPPGVPVGCHVVSC